MPYLLAIFIGGLVRVVEEKHLKYLAVGYFILSLIFTFVSGEIYNPGLVLLLLAIKSALVYGWILLLDRFEDSIFTYILIMFLGVILFGIF